MDMNEYQRLAMRTAKLRGNYLHPDLTYAALKLAGETGEFTEKLGKIIRGKDGVFSDTDRLDLIKELGDVLWYIQRISTWFNVPLATVAQINLDKLADRQKRDALGGSGDNR